MRNTIKEICHKAIGKYESQECGNKVFLYGNIRICKRLFPTKCFEKYEKMQFEDDVFLVPQGYDSFLKISYGDYIKLPPESERGVKLLL